MDKTTEIIREYYDVTVEEEWERIRNRPEFLLTCRMLNRYIKPGDRVLDIGGGPGRYALYLAEKGCDVTLLDLSPENAKFAKAKAAELKVFLKTLCGDAREADTIASGQFDHVLLMGPLYHLLEEKERVKAVNAALQLLAPKGVLFATFINMIAGFIFAMKEAPELMLSGLLADIEYRENFVAGKNFAGDAFTKAFFIHQGEILPFMAQFPLEKLHLFSQEGILSPCEANIFAQPREVIDAWLDFCETVWEREELLSWAEHIMYVGRKK